MFSGNALTREQFIKLASYSETDKVEAFIKENGKNSEMLNFKDTNGLTALGHAACKGNEELMMLLLEAPAIDINIQNNFGFTPIALASYYGHIGCVALLMTYGADTTIRTKQGCDAAEAADHGKHSIIAKMLRKHHENQASHKLQSSIK